MLRGLRSRRTRAPAPAASSPVLRRTSTAGSDVGVEEQRGVVGGADRGQFDQVDEALEAEREAHGRHSCAEESPIIRRSGHRRRASSDRGVRELEDRAGVVPHAAHEERIEDQGDVGRPGPGDGIARRRRGADDRVVGRAVGQRLADPAFAEDGVYSMVCGETQEGIERVDAPPSCSALAQFLATPSGPILSSLSIVMSDAGSLLCRVEPEALSSIQSRHRRSLIRTVRPSSPSASTASSEATMSSASARESRLADDVDVALHELAVAALLRALCTPDRTDLDRPEYGGELAR